MWWHFLHHSCDSLACCVHGIILAIRWHAVSMGHHSCTSLACCVYGNIILAIRWHAVSMQMEKWERDEHVVALPSSLKNGDVVEVREDMGKLSWCVVCIYLLVCVYVCVCDLATLFVVLPSAGHVRGLLSLAMCV